MQFQLSSMWPSAAKGRTRSQTILRIASIGADRPLSQPFYTLRHRFVLAPQTVKAPIADAA